MGKRKSCYHESATYYRFSLHIESVAFIFNALLFLAYASLNLEYNSNRLLYRSLRGIVLCSSRGVGSFC